MQLQKIVEIQSFAIIREYHHTIIFRRVYLSSIIFNSEGFFSITNINPNKNNPCPFYCQVWTIENPMTYWLFGQNKHA